VLVLMVTVCVTLYVPAAGLNVGAAANGMIVKVAELTVLSASPAAKAAALSVVVLLTDMGAVNNVPTVELGELPSVV
jgi:hypothetical protein